MEYLPRPRQRQYHSPSPTANHQNSLYIFPSPSSAPPSPSPSSEYSAPTLSTLSGARSRDSSVQLFSSSSRDRRPHLEGPQFTDPYVVGTCGDPAVETWDGADTDGTVDESVFNESEVGRGEQWELLYYRQFARVRESSPLQVEWLRFESTRSSTRKGRTYRGSSTSARPSSPHPRIHIPLLSFFMSLFSVDEATLHLLTHSAPDSALFPGHALCTDDSHTPQDEECHGVAKLLVPLGESRSMKQGFAVACDPSFTPKISSFPFVGIWYFIGDVLVDGGKALREFWS